MTEKPGKPVVPPANGEAGKAEGGEKEQKQKKPSVWSKLKTKVGTKIGLVERTTLEPKFVEERLNVERYRARVDRLLDGFEAVLQPDPKVLAIPSNGALPVAGELSWELLARASGALHCCLTNDYQQGMMWLVLLANKLACIEREGLTRMRGSIRHVRQFVTTDHKRMKEMVEKVDECLHTMDATRHEIKAAKAPDELERVGKIYVRSIREFDSTCKEINEVIQTLNDTRYRHQKNTVAFYDMMEQYHRRMATAIHDALKDVNPDGIHKNEPKPKERPTAARHSMMNRVAVAATSTEQHTKEKTTDGKTEGRTEGKTDAKTETKVDGKTTTEGNKEDHEEEKPE